ncbi:MAG TPA: hypothetical protein DEA28_01130 [Firmicutes bacterium]|nr:hypothetical protein [Bacillota bacterium]
MEDLRSRYKIKTTTFINNSDYNEFLYTLYLPLIGYKAVFLYELLINLVKYGIKEIYLDDLIKETTLSTQDFFFERKVLESISLISFYKKSDLEYMIIINGIHSPKNFFNDDIFKGLLINRIGEDKVLSLMEHYKIDDDTTSYKNISSSINDNFIVDFDYNSLKVGEDIKLVSNNKAQIKDDFSDSIFFNYLKEKSNINPSAITLEELKKIHNCGVIYDLNEKIMAQITIDSIDLEKKIGEKVDISKVFDRAKKEIVAAKHYNKKIYKNNNAIVSGNSDIAKDVQYYQTISPRALLRERQNGVEPVASDISIIDYLELNMDLPIPVINVIIDYTLKRLDNKLNRAYIEKVAASLKRKKCETALDAMEILYKKNDNKRNYGSNVSNVNVTNNENFVKENNDEEVDDDWDFDDLWKK